MTDFILTAHELETHQKLVRIIEEEAQLIKTLVECREKQKHLDILNFLIELQIRSSKEMRA